MKLNLQLFLIIFVLLILSSSAVQAREQVLPLNISYGMLNSLVVKSYYTDPGETALVLDQESGCRQVVLSDPVFSREQGYLALETRVRVKVGKRVFGHCFSPMTWKGYVVLYQRPVMLQSGWRMGFETIDSKVLNKERDLAKIAGLVWNLIKENVYSYLEGIELDLGPPVKELQSFLRPLFPEEKSDLGLELVKSMHPGKVLIQEKGLRLENRVQVEEKLLGKEREEKELSKKELSEFVASWEKFDSFLVQIFLSLMDKPLTPEDRQVLLDTLLQVRYRFVQELDSPAQGKDFVREEFIFAWKSVQPIFKRHLSEDKNSLLSYLAFFTASDALVALDVFGPRLGVEISEDGLLRLARLLIEDEHPVLKYSPEVNKDLRELLGFSSSLDSNKENESLFKEQSWLDRVKRIQNSLTLTSEAVAGEAKKSEDYLKDWVFQKKELSAYLEKMKKLLLQAAEEAGSESKLSKEHLALYRILTLALCWQESCFRQFVQKNGKIVYLRSYNNTSVGLMQINERVWRGLYDIERLRWEVEYNAKAGCEILRTYFQRYALRYIKNMKQEVDWNQEKLAGVIYAMYNGGPGQFKKFIIRYAKKDFYLSDRLFLEKFNWVLEEDWEKLKKCLM